MKIFPSFISYNPRNSNRMNFEFIGNFFLSAFSASDMFSYINNIFLGKNCVWETCASFFRRIFHIFRSCSRKKMSWSNAFSNITFMADFIGEVWERSFKEFPGYPMGSPIFTIHSELSIPSFKNRCSPEPAGSCFVDMLKKSIFRIFNSFEFESGALGEYMSHGSIIAYKDYI